MTYFGSTRVRGAAALSVVLAALVAALALGSVSDAAAQLSFKETPTGWSVTSGEADDSVGEVRAKGLKKKNRIRYSLAGPSSFSIKPRTGVVQYDGGAIASDVTETQLAVTATDRQGKASPATITITVSVTQPATEPALQQQVDPDPEEKPQVGNIPAQNSLRISKYHAQDPLLYAANNNASVTTLTINRTKTIYHNRYSTREGRVIYNIPEEVALHTKAEGVEWYIVDNFGVARKTPYEGFSVTDNGTVKFDYYQSDWQTCTPGAQLRSHTALGATRTDSSTRVGYETICPPKGRYRDTIFPKGYTYTLTVEARHGGQTARLDITVSAIGGP